MRELAARLSPEDVVISDASFSAGWIASHIPAQQAGRGFLFARGQGGLGYAVPAAIGAAAAMPNGRVITVSGDGGFSYAIGELATHAQQGLRTVNLVLNNGTLSWLAIWQRLFFDGLRQSVDLEGEGVSPNFATVAGGLGCEGLRVEQLDEIGEALDKAFAATRPVVVDLRTDPMATPIHSYRRRLAPRTAPCTSCRRGAAARSCHRSTDQTEGWANGEAIRRQGRVCHGRLHRDRAGDGRPARDRRSSCGRQRATVGRSR